MSEALKKMLARTGRQWDDFRPNSKEGFIMRQQGVPRSPEFERIAALPRRKWDDNPDIEFLQEEMTDWLKVPGGTRRLRPLQAAALADLHDYGSVFAPISCGGGKTDLSYLAPTVMEACYPVLLIPASLREKTEIEYEELAKHWRQPVNLKIVSYQQLGRKRFVRVLEDRCPDLIICDEVQYIRNLTAACTERVRRWMSIQPDTPFIAMSGTITKRSLMDFHHLLLWTLGRQNMPLPFEPSETRRWSLAIDSKIPTGRRMSPGVLVEFVDKPTQQPTLEEVRCGLSDRIMNTPGVVSSLTDDCDASILMNFYDPGVPAEVQAQMDQIIADGESLCGDIMLSPVETWRHLRELTCGFNYYWVEKPPREWMTHRRNFHGFIRRILERRYEGIHSPEQVIDAIKEGRLNSNGLYEMWLQVEPLFKPVTATNWISTKVLEEVLQRHTRHPTLIWIDHDAVGEKLVELSGLRFFKRGGVDQTGTAIERLDGSESLILSIKSNIEGRNLQKWFRNCIVTPPTDGETFEQLVARTHRPGQEADPVEFEVLLGHRVLIDGMRQALADAKYSQAITRKPQKLLMADRIGIHIQPR